MVCAMVVAHPEFDFQIQGHLQALREFSQGTWAFPSHQKPTLGAVTPDLLPMGNLGVTAWVGFTLGYDRLPICGYTLVNYPRGR